MSEERSMLRNSVVLSAILQRYQGSSEGCYTWGGEDQMKLCLWWSWAVRMAVTGAHGCTRSKLERTQGPHSVPPQPASPTHRLLHTDLPGLGQPLLRLMERNRLHVPAELHKLCSQTLQKGSCISLLPGCTSSTWNWIPMEPTMKFNRHKDTGTKLWDNESDAHCGKQPPAAPHAPPTRGNWGINHNKPKLILSPLKTVIN